MFFMVMYISFFFDIYVYILFLLKVILCFRLYAMYRDLVYTTVVGFYLLSGEKIWGWGCGGVEFWNG
jgi:hypothetical protein